MRIRSLVVLVALPFFAGACGQARNAWAEEAVGYVTAAQQEFAADIALAAGRYVSSDIELDLCCDSGSIARGRRAYAQFMTSLFSQSAASATVGGLYLDVTGAVSQWHYEQGDDELVVWELNEHGLVVMEIHPVSIQSLGVEGIHWESPDGVEGLVAHYLAGWSSADPGELRGLYSVDATLVDSVEGIELAGQDAIESYRANPNEGDDGPDCLGTRFPNRGDRPSTCIGPGAGTTPFSTACTCSLPTPATTGADAREVSWPI